MSLNKQKSSKTPLDASGIASPVESAKRIAIGKPGPFQIIESEVQGHIDNPINAPRRRYDCPHYETCLVIAAGLNWDSFTCRGCSGEYEQSLNWRARQEINKDKTVKKICEMPKALVPSEAKTQDSTKTLIHEAVEKTITRLVKSGPITSEVSKQERANKAPAFKLTVVEKTPNLTKLTE